MSLITLMAAGTAALDAAIILVVLALFTRQFGTVVKAFVRNWAFPLTLFLVVVSIAGTLWMQYAALLNPCLLCWWQRIFMYPIVIIAGIAFIKNEKFSAIADYVLALSILGSLVALYQHLLQVMPTNPILIPCDATGDCAVRSVFDFGFVTIPWMAFTVFVALAIIAYIARKQ